MHNRMLLPAIVLSLLFSTSVAMAFDFQKIDKQVEQGKLSPEQVKMIIDKAIQNGEITPEQLHEHMEKIHPGFPPPFGGPGHDEFIQKLQKAGITKEQFDKAMEKGPAEADKLLKKHGITPPQHPPFPPCCRCCCPPPPFGGPGHDEFIQKLQKAGITKEQFDKAIEKGPAEADKLLKKHGITPPIQSQ